MARLADDHGPAAARWREQEGNFNADTVYAAVPLHLRYLHDGDYGSPSADTGKGTRHPRNPG